MRGTGQTEVKDNALAKKKNSASFLEKRSKKLLSLGLLVWLAGCGFRPLYGDHAQVQSQLAGISVGLIPDRTGQILRQELQRRLDGASGGGPTLYNLSVNVQISTDNAGILASNSVATRQRQNAKAQWVLRDATGSQAVVGKGDVSAADAENILNQQYFAADTETEAVNQRLMELLADQITGQIAAKLGSKTKG